MNRHAAAFGAADVAVKQVSRRPHVKPAVSAIFTTSAGVTPPRCLSAERHSRRS